jgi:hypothetical protein
MATFFETVTAAINDLIEHGYDSEERLERWVRALSEAATAELIPEQQLQAQLQRVLGGAYQRLIEQGSILQRHPGVDRFTLAHLKPKLRAELDRRLLASAALIRLNRAQTINDTLRRFSGWATSIPAGGTEAVDRRAVKNNIRKELASNSFRERRVLIDQGHKLNAALSDIIATDAGAIAAEWHSHWRQMGYQYRPEHKQRDGVVYAVRDGNWALDAGLMKPGPGGFYEDHERPGEFVFCRCYVRWIYNLRDLPQAMLTEKGAAQLKAVQAQIKAA